MNKKIKISVITICYNSEKTINKTIESIVNQQYDNLEYWIIDGGSTDKTMEIVKRFSKHNSCIHYISEPDEGISDAFNKGITRATGELIVLINSDDQLNSKALSMVNSEYQKNTSDVIYGDAIIFDPRNNLKIYKVAGKPDRLKYEMPFIHQSCFIKKEIYNKYGGYLDKYKICMDYEFLARIYSRGVTFSYIAYPLSTFKYGGTSCKHPFKTINENIVVAKTYGLPTREAHKFKSKVIIRNIIKLTLEKLHIYGYMYRIFKNNHLIN